MGKIKFSKDYNIERILHVVTFSLISILSFIGVIAASPYSFAINTNSEKSNVSVTVPNSCTLSGEVISAHTATIANGLLQSDIGTTKMKIFCNDSGGYTVYAIGAGDDEDGNTNMISSIGGNNIATGLGTSGNTSAWAMKLAAGSGTGSTTTPPTIASDSAGSFTAYHVVPNTYTTVASRPSATDMDPDVDVSGSYFTTTYRVYVGNNQPAATYTGKVKYAVMHPQNNDNLVGIDTALSDAGAPTKEVDGKIYHTIQGLSSSICNDVNVTGPGGATKLVDARDDNIYWVTKLPDGKCWMLDNLRLDPTDPTTAANMNESNTHAPAAAITNYLNGSSTAPQTGWSTAAVADVDTDFNSYTDPRINNAYTDTTTTGYGVGSGKTGIYYNYCAATVGTYCYASGAGVGNASYDVCPTNWRMPTGGASGEYQSLCTTLWGSECSYNMSMPGTNSSSIQYQLSAPLSGYYSGSQANGQGYSGNFWSSTRASGNSMYYLDINSSGVYPQGSSTRYLGFSVRCVVNDTDYMQNVTSSDLARVMPDVGDTTTLTDARDNQKYKVAKVADGNYWMIENLKIGKTLSSGQSLTLTSSDSDVDSDFTMNYSDIPSDGKFHAYTVEGVDYQNNSNEWICRGGENDWDSCYYNWYTATAGAGTTYVTSGAVDTSICPAGWILPTQPQFSALYNQYPSAAQMEVDNPTTTKNNFAGKIPGFLLSGFYNIGGADSLGSRGYYWSRTAHNAQDAYGLFVNTSSVYTAGNSSKYYGFAVRCIKN